ncbi:MAG: peptidylprolyl isomerase [SAR324 cluster bacterium]|nr:peptidylprolyl isomerase [SAR324 cluster bacterium]
MTNWKLLWIVCLLWMIPCSMLMGQTLPSTSEKVATVNGFVISSKAFLVLESYLQKTREFTNRKDLLDSLIINHLLAEKAAKALPAEQLWDDTSRQRFEQDYQSVMIHARDTLKIPFSKQEALVFLAAPPKIPETRLIALMDKLKNPEALIQQDLRDQLLHQPETRKINLLTYAFTAQPTQHITLYDVIQHENPHGMAEIRNGNMAYLQSQTLDLYFQRHLRYWAQSAKNPEHALFAELEPLVSDRYIAEHYLNHLGLNPGFKEDRTVIKKRAKAIPGSEIETHFRNNAERYTHVQEVHARHILLAQQDTADDVYQKLMDGADFSEMVRQYSLAPDKNKPVPGQLEPLFNKADGSLPFLHKICLIQPEGVISRSIRSPEGYEIVLVDKRIEGLRPLDEALIGEISKELALVALRRDTENLRKDLSSHSKIEINQSFLKESTK